MYVCSKPKYLIYPFTEASWSKFVQSPLQLQNVDSKESILAEKAVERFNLNSAPQNHMLGNVGFHKGCYSNFTNTSNIAKTCKRCENAALEKIFQTEGCV